jgi:hypothetical protein
VVDRKSKIGRLGKAQNVNFKNMVVIFCVNRQRKGVWATPQIINTYKYNNYNRLIIETTYIDMQREASITIETIKNGPPIKFWNMKKRNGVVKFRPKAWKLKSIETGKRNGR